MNQSHLLILTTLFLLSCYAQNKTQKHVFYLHGRIIEVQGIHAVSEQFGVYEYEKIIEALKKTGARVHNEVRTTETDFSSFSESVSNQIDSLIQGGVAANDITVIGASKGAVMTMYISHLNSHPINYILLGANNDSIEEQYDWQLHGNILGIYEKSDQLAGKNYQYWIDRSTDAVKFQQLEINTGLGHGFIYRPLREWLAPAIEWTN